MAKLQKNAAKIRAVLRREGFSPLAINASLARMRQESTLNPKALRKNDAGPGKHSRGLFQWNRKRLANGQKFAKSNGLDWDDVETQALFYAKEVKGEIGTEGEYGARLLSAKTDEDAAKAAISLARPKHWTPNDPTKGHGWKNTLNWTKDFAAQQQGESTEKFGESFKVADKDNHTGGLIDLNNVLPEIATTVSDSDPDLADPIDNSPGAVLNQIITGLSTAVSKSAKESEDKPSMSMLDTSFMDVMQRGTREAPTATNIATMIKKLV